MTLFNDIIFGPIRSRRLGNSLGINLLPLETKWCNFNCIYCECGWNTTSKISKKQLPNKTEIITLLKKKLEDVTIHNTINTITFAGNGEPTLHPDFAEISEAVVSFRNHHLPHVQIAVLSNGVLLKREKIKRALMSVDKCILKLDAGSERLFRLINKPVGDLMLDEIVDRFSHYKGELIIQSLFLKGRINGVDLSNVYAEQVDTWIEKILKIQPKQVMIYTLDRETPSKGLEKASLQEMTDIAIQLENKGIDTIVYA